MSTDSKYNGIYIASRVRHAPKWHELREQGTPITSTWIDSGDGPDIDMRGIWYRCIDEASKSVATVLYREDDELLKGALIEAGAALGAGKPVYTVGFNGPEDMKIFSFLYHPMVVRCESLDCALSLASALIRPATR